MPKPFFFAALLCCAFSASEASVEPPKLRLGEDVRPVRYSVDLTLIPDEDTFSGAIEIDLDIRKPADVIWLNARSQTIDHANLVAGGRTLNAKIEQGGEDYAGFVFSPAAPAGKAKLQIAYRGELSKKGTGGLFKLEEGGNWYIYSQFEAVDARRAFPCFDEPSFKVPWQLTLHIKKDHAAVSNTPVLSESAENGGRKKVIFAETKPLPSYLVAMAVGPLEFVDAGKAGKKQTPLRIITPKGEGSQAKYAAQVTGQILKQLEDYFGIPYPYEKLDGIAIPVTFGFGAMENPGLITYGQNLILSEPAQDSIRRQRGYAGVAAHEMAHMWFGDLVTTAWWDDIWLNEAFASWMAAKVIHQWKPEWNTKVDEQNSRLGAMEEDSLVSARKIRQPIESNNDIANAFDGITYSKGEAVIGMFERWMGEDAFRRGVQRYLKQYSWRNTTAADFLDSLGSSGDQQVGRAFSTFLDQPGVPLVSVKLQCDSAGGATLQLSQKRALPLGSQGSTQQTWQIPVCVRYGEGDRTGRECTLLTETSKEWKLAGAKSCPAWVLANAEGAGYYRASYEGQVLGSLLADGARNLSAAERVATLGDVEALTRMGEIKAADALALVPRFARDPVRQVANSAVGITGSVRAHLVPRELFPNYMRFVNQAFGERARQLGWNPKASEDSETRLLRSSIVPLVAVWGGDQTLAAEARELADRWLQDRKSLDPDVVGLVLTVAARTGDRVLFDRLVAALSSTQDRRQRQHIVSALGGFRDPEIARAAMQMVLRPEFDMKEADPLLFGPLSSPTTSALPFAFVKENYEAIVAKLPTGDIFNLGVFLPFVGGDFCDEKSRQEVAAFFEPRLGRFPGSKRNLDQALEGIRLCEAFKTAQEASVAEFLRKY